MAVVVSFLTTFGVHFVIILCILGFSYYFLNQRDPLEAEPQSERDQNNIPKDFSHNASGDDDEVAPALPDDLQHVPYEGISLSEEEMIDKSKAFLEFIKSRRSVRFYSDKPIPDEVIDNIIEAAGTSPSGAHTEPWTYVVVTDQEKKSQIREIIENEERINYEKRMGVKWTTDLKPLKTTWEKPYLTQAHALVLLFKQIHGWTPDGRKKIHYYNEISCSISAGLFLAAVHTAGLVTLTSTPLNCGPALRELLDRPKNEKLLMLLPIGYAADDATVPGLQRKPLEEYMIKI